MFRMIAEGREGLIVPIVIHRAEGNHNGGRVEAMVLERAMMVGEGGLEHLRLMRLSAKHPQKACG